MSKLINKVKVLNNVHVIENCNGCLLCVFMCPTKSITIDSNTEQISVNRKKCLGCYLCKQVCPINSITFAKSNYKIEELKFHCKTQPGRLHRMKQNKK